MWENFQRGEFSIGSAVSEEELSQGDYIQGNLPEFYPKFFLFDILTL